MDRVVERWYRTRSGTIRLPNGVVRVDPDWFRCRYQVRPLVATRPSDEAMMPRAVLWKERCLIVKVPRDGTDGAFVELYLIDAWKGELSAMYMKPM